jgi:hypothetical protein
MPTTEGTVGVGDEVKATKCDSAGIKPLEHRADCI